FFDLATSQQVHKLAEYEVPISLLAFAPDGRTLACAYRDGTALVWNVASVIPKAWSGPRPALDENWLALESVEAPVAWKAHWALVQGEAHTVSYLKERLKPVRPPVVRPVRPRLKG